MKHKHCLLFIPAKDEAKTIKSVITACREELQKLFTDVSVLVVNDGSTDTTQQCAKEAGACVITHKTNQGLGKAFQRAVSYAVETKVDFMLTIDADEQFTAKDIPLFFEKQEEEQADMVTGSRFLPSSSLTGIPKVKRVGNHCMTLLVNTLLKSSYTDVSCGYRLYTREALLHLTLSGDFTYTQEVFLNLGYKQKCIAEVPITVQYFKTRTSRIAHSLWKYAKRTSAIILKSVVRYQPLRLFGWLSVALGILGAGLLVPLTIRFFLLHQFSPYKFLAITGGTFLILSFISLVLGLILHTMSLTLLQTEHVLYYAKKQSSRS